MKLLPILLERDTTKKNKLIFFRQTADSILKKFEGKTVIVFDTETTGFKVPLPWVQVTEIASISYDMDKGREIDRFHTKIKLKPKTISKIKDQKKNTEDPNDFPIQKIFKFTRYGDKNAPFSEYKTAYQNWVNWVSKYDKPILVAQNAGFDMGHMFAPLKDLGISRPNYEEVIDTLTLARVWIYPLLKASAELGDEKSKETLDKFNVEKRGKVQPSFALNKLGQAFKVSTDQWHSGMADTLQTLGILTKMLSILKDAKDKNLEDTETFKKWHAEMSSSAFKYGKRPAF